MSYIGREPQIGNFQVCDAISTVNNQAAYTMQVGGVNVSPETANHMLVSLNGILQAPTSSFTVSGSTITFASNLVTGDVINFIHILGSVLDLGVPSDATVSTAKIVDGAVTAAKLASGAGGKVLQVISATDSTNRSTSSTSFVTASNTLSVDITPSATSSKIFVIATLPFHSASGATIFGTIYRDSTNLGGTKGMNQANGNIHNGSGMTFLDSPSSTSQLTYQVYAKVDSGTGNFGGDSTCLSSITAFEIGA